MLHVKDLEAPYYHHFDIRREFEEFTHHLSLVNGLPSKNVFVSQYNDWAQKSNLLLRSLQQTKRKWQNVVSSYQNVSIIATLLCVLSCLASLWIGKWRWALLSLVAHIIVKHIQTFSDEKVIAATHVKTTLKNTFWGVSRMRLCLTQIQTALKVPYRFPREDTSREEPVIDSSDKPVCRLHAQYIVPNLFSFECVLGLCTIIIFVAVYSVCEWSNYESVDNYLMYSYFPNLSVTISFISVSSYAVFAYVFVKRSDVFHNELAVESDIFMKWYTDWVNSAKIRIDFCHYKFCLLNLAHYDDRKCSLHDSHCAFLTLWFLTSLEGLLRSGVINRNSQNAVIKLFSNIPINDQSFLDVQYIVCRLQTILKASSRESNSKLDGFKVSIARGCTSRGYESPTSRQTSTALPSVSAHFDTVNNCTVCAKTSLCCDHVQHSKVLNSSSHSGSSTRSLCSLLCVLNHSPENETSHHLESSHRSSTPKMSSRSNSRALSGCTKTSRISGFDVNSESMSYSEMENDVSSESVISSVRGSCPSEISASESSISSKEPQRFNCTSAKNESNELIPLGIPHSKINQSDENSLSCRDSVSLKPSTRNELIPLGISHSKISQSDENSVSCCDSVSLKRSTKKFLMAKRKHLDRKKCARDNSVTSPETSESSLEKIPQTMGYFSDPDSLSSIVKYSTFASAEQNSFCMPTGDTLTEPELEVEDVGCVPQEEDQDERKNGEACCEESANLPGSRVGDNSLQNKVELQPIAGKMKRSSEPKTETLEETEANFFVGLKTDLFSKTSDSDFSEKASKCSEKHKSSNFWELSKCDQDLNDSEVLTLLSDDYKNVSKDSRENITGEVHEDTDHQGKKTENLFDSIFPDDRVSISSDQSDIRSKDAEFILLSTRNEKPAILSDKQQIDRKAVYPKNSIENTIPKQLYFACYPDVEASTDVHWEHRKDFHRPYSTSDSGIPINEKGSASKAGHSGHDCHKHKSMENFPFANLSNPTSGQRVTRISSISRQTRSIASEVDSEEKSFPMVSSEDENFKFHPESGCTSDTPYSEQQSLPDEPTVMWKSDRKKEHKPDCSKDLRKNSSGTKAETNVSVPNGTFKFDNFDFAFDLQAGSENVTLKFYCDSEGECNEFVQPAKKKNNYHTIPKNSRSEFSDKEPVPLETHGGVHVPFRKSSYDRNSQSEELPDETLIGEKTFPESHGFEKSPLESCSDSESRYSCADHFLLWNSNSDSTRRELKRTVQFKLDGINFNFKRRRNSGPVKVQYHRRCEAKDFLFKSRFKRFRFRCGNPAPRTEYYEQQQVPYESNSQVEHSENGSNF